MYSISPQATRELIDKYFLLQWCRDNYVIPISIESNQSSSDDIFWIAIANYAYLGTIANPIKERIKQNMPKIEIIFIEKSPEEIQEILDLASSVEK